jgi:hypothetical protein
MPTLKLPELPAPTPKVEPQPVPQPTPVPAVPAPALSDGWTNLKATLAMLLGNAAAVGAGVVGTPAVGSPGGTLTGLLLPIGIAVAGLAGVPAPILKVVSAILPTISVARSTK